MAAASQGNFEGKFESLDLAELAKKQPWWRTLFGQESGPSAEKYSVATQLLIGGVTGWCTGFIFQKVGKLAATAVGGGFFLLQLANHTGYIKVDWQCVEKDMKKAKEQLKIRKSNQIPTEVKSKAEEVRLHFISVQPKGVDNFVCTKMEKTYPYVSLGWNIFTSEAFSKGPVEGLVTYWGCRHTCGLIIP